MDLQIIAAIVFLVALLLLLIIERKRLHVQKILSWAMYLVLYRTKFGLSFMDKLSERYRNLIRLIGYCCIGIGFVGMVYISLSIIIVIFQLLIRPETAESGMALVLPFTNVPGVGYLPFLYWIISIFVLAVVHEAAHGIMARAHDVRVKSSGFAVFSIFIPIIPAAFVEPDEKQLAKMPDHTQYAILSAGPVANIILSLLILLIMTFVFVPFELRITEPVGFAFDLVNETTPAAQAGLRSGMILTSYNGIQILDANKAVSDVTNCKRPGDIIYFGNTTSSFTITLGTNPEDSSKPYMGVTNIRNEREVKKEWMWFKPIFYWIKGLFKWLGLLNFFIGLANLLPLGIFDGGRMIQLALNSTMKNKLRAKKIFVYISLFFLFALLFGLLTAYVGNPFSLLP